MAIIISLPLSNNITEYMYVYAFLASHIRSSEVYFKDFSFHAQLPFLEALHKIIFQVKTQEIIIVNALLAVLNHVS